MDLSLTDREDWYERQWDRIVDETFESQPIRVVTMFDLNKTPRPGLYSPEMEKMAVGKATKGGEDEVLLGRAQKWKVTYAETVQDANGLPLVFRVVEPADR